MVAARARRERMVAGGMDHFDGRPDESGAAQRQAEEAAALLHRGRRRQAEAAFRRLMRTYPGFLPGLLGLLRTLLFAGERERAFLALETSSFQHVDVPALVWTKFEILIGLHRLADARAEFGRMLRTMTEPDLLVSLFVFVPQLYEGCQRVRAWSALLEKAEIFAKAGGTPQEGLSTMRLRLLLALRQYDRFLAEVAAVPAQCALGGHGTALRAVAAALSARPCPRYQKPKIFGIGLSRTGTTSLATALGMLGFATLHWFNPLTCELISDDDLYLFDAFTDTPVCANFEKYYYMLPTAKFIYTKRPVDEWKKSVVGHFKRLTGAADFQTYKDAIERPDWLPFGTAFRGLHQALYFSHADYESAYRAHDERVRHFFADKPNARFLEFDLFAGHGWYELCAFTGRPVPSVPYPLQNPMTSEPELSCPYVDAAEDRRRLELATG
jgi:hypothetical protein